MKKVYKIFPTVGIARIGNSLSYFLGPESPGIVPEGPFRDAQGKMRPQGARFRIYEFDRDQDGNDTCNQEIREGKNVKITWKVHMVNRKAAGGQFPPGGEGAPPRNVEFDRRGLVIDPKEQTIAGSNKSLGPIKSRIQFKKGKRVQGEAEVELGTLKTDSEGRLIVVGGPGKAGTPINRELTQFANNDGWYDGVSDGPVKAAVKIGKSKVVEAESAWVVVTPPSYAPGIENVVTWYDQAVNVNAKQFTPVIMAHRPSFTKDIFPILKRAVELHWVVRKDQRYHGSPGNFLDPARLALLSNNSTDSRKPREDVFNRLVKPNTPAEAAEQYPIEPPNMPRLYSGLDPENPKLAEYASLTDFQYTMMSRWAIGEFDADWNSYPTFRPLEQMPLSEQPQALTRATLESCVGSPFYPGIEGTYVIAQASTYESPFRINRNLPPGYLTERMALPWQADFLDCANLWWPAQRPVDVFTQSEVIKPFARGINRYGDMVSSWTELGFIVRKGTEYIETERRPINGED